MTKPLYRDAYLKEANGVVVGHTDEGGVVLDSSLFYPTGGGQPGDSGALVWDGGTMPVATAIKRDNQIVHVPEEGAQLPPVGARVNQRINWQVRHRLMRVHTALHLLSVVIPLPVTGGAITNVKGRLDFDMPEAPQDKEAIEEALNALIARELDVTESWITDAELAAAPELVKTMSVKPPVGAGHVRLIRIGSEQEQIDLQPCGGTHVKNTHEIGPMRLGKIEKKSRLNRRVNIHLTDV